MTNLCVWQDLLEFSSAFAFASTDEGVSESDQLGLEECLSNDLDDGAALVAILQPTEQDGLGDTDEAASSLPAHLSPVTSPISIGEIFLTTGENMVSRGDGFVSTTAVGSLPSICPRGVLLVSGSWYFEVVVAVEGVGAVGWATPEYAGNSAAAEGLGDDANSWALRSDGQRSHARNQEPFGQVWCVGDVIGCALVISNGAVSMQFSYNGNEMQVAFEIEQLELGFTPFLTFDSSFSAQVNWGNRAFSRPVPAAHQSVQHWIRRRIEFLVARGAHLHNRLGKVVPTTGDSNARIEDLEDGQFIFYSERAGSGQTAFPSVKLDGVVLTSGCWYYECTVVATEHGATQLGWADLQFIGSNREGVGVGDDKWSWAYDGDRTCLWSGQYRVFGEGSISWGKQWENGDVVGICVICCSIH